MNGSTDVAESNSAERLKERRQISGWEKSNPAASILDCLRFPPGAGLSGRTAGTYQGNRERLPTPVAMLSGAGGSVNAGALQTLSDFLLPNRLVALCLSAKVFSLFNRDATWH